MQNEIAKSNVKRIHELSPIAALTYLGIGISFHFYDIPRYYPWAFSIFFFLTVAFYFFTKPTRQRKTSLMKGITLVVLYMFAMFGTVLSVFDIINGSPPYFYFVCFAAAVSFFIFNPQQLIVYNLFFMFTFLLVTSQHMLLDVHFIFVVVFFHFVFLILGYEKYQVNYSNVSTNIELEKLNKELEVLSTIDQLSGCKNRRGLLYEIEKYQDNEVFAMLTDIDDFKDINDRFGHVIGDLYIANFSKILQTYFGVKNVFRVGGDEFFVLSDKHTEEVFLEKFESFKEKIQQVSLVSNSKLKMTASAGYAYTKINDKNNFDNIYKKLDIALYKAKDDGKNTIFKADC